MGFGLKGPFVVIVEFIRVHKPICTFTSVDIYTYTFFETIMEWWRVQDLVIVMQHKATCCMGKKTLYYIQLNAIRAALRKQVICSFSTRPFGPEGSAQCLCSDSFAQRSHTLFPEYAGATIPVSLVLFFLSFS